MNVTDNQSLFIFISHWWYRGEAADPRPPEASRAFRDAQWRRGAKTSSEPRSWACRT